MGQRGHFVHSTGECRQSSNWTYRGLRGFEGIEHLPQLLVAAGAAKVAVGAALQRQASAFQSCPLGVLLPFRCLGHIPGSPSLVSPETLQIEGKMKTDLSSDSEQRKR